MSLNRRSFIRYASLAAAGNAAGFRPFGALNGLAQSAPGYKALVCIFMFGGNDSNNTLVPFNTTANGANGYTAYSNIRGPLAIPAASLLTLGSQANGNYGLHPSLPNTQALFNSNNIAFVTNVGTLVQPLTPAQFQAGGYRRQPTSFLIQTSSWSGRTRHRAGVTSTGWAGRIADSMAATYNPGAQIPLITSVYGDTLFCNGASSSPVAVDPGNLQGGACSEGASVCATRLATAQQLVTFSNGLSLVQADNAITANSYQYMAALANAVQSVTPLTTVFPAQQQPCGAIAADRPDHPGAGGAGSDEADFLCRPWKLRHPFQPVCPFRQVCSRKSMERWRPSIRPPRSSALPTRSPPSPCRTSTGPCNLTRTPGATTPGAGISWSWAGRSTAARSTAPIPSWCSAGPNDSGVNGRWVPTLASSQYAATLASWFGVPSGSLNTIFPTLPNFSTTNLGFV